MKFQTLNLNAPGESKAEPGFWKRQFLQAPTEQQIKFDWYYGVGLPLVCFAADPFVFTYRGMLGGYWQFAYLLGAVSIMGMAAWLLWGNRLRWVAAPLGGLFIVAGLISLLVGVILLPFSFIGLFILIGFLGLTPLFSGVVFLRNGVRAIRASESFMQGRLVWQAAVLAALFALAIPYVVQANTNWLQNRRSAWLPEIIN